MILFSERPRTLHPVAARPKISFRADFFGKAPHLRRRISRRKSNQIDYFRSQNQVAEYSRSVRGNAETTEISIDWRRSIRRRSAAVLAGQINMEVDLRPEAADEAFLAGRQNKSQVAANQDDNRGNRVVQRFLLTGTTVPSAR